VIRPPLNGHPFVPPGRTPTTQAAFRPAATCLLVAVLAFLGDSLSAQEPEPTGRVRLSGYVRSSASREVIRGAQLVAGSEGIRAETNQDGFFVLSLPRGVTPIRIRAVGYYPDTTTVELTTSLSRDFLLTPRPYELEEVAVQGGRDSSDIDPGTVEMSTARVDIRTVRLIPAVLGEVDPIRTLTLLPGVSNASDFTTGFSVRGGTVDQNLIRLDEATIYNPSHVFGFFSVFNGDAVDDVKLYKGAIPARFGGRLSSVLDVRQREGSRNRVEGTGSVGVLASRLAVEGPLPNELGSFLVAGRRTYADLFLRLSSNPELNRNTAYFYDLNVKTTLRLGSNGSLMLAGYRGRDRLGLIDRFQAGWGNTAGSAVWNQAVGNRIFSKVVLASSEYDYALDFLGTGRDLRWASRIGGTTFEVNETFYIGNGNTVEAGAELVWHRIEPGSIDPVGASPVVPFRLDERRGTSRAVHLSHEIDLTPAVSVRYGIRYAGFHRNGPGTLYQYADNAPVVYDRVLERYQRGEPIDSVRYGTGERIAGFAGLEPRVSLRVGVSPTASLKASYTRTRQYLHLVSNSNAPTPVDVWEPVGPYLDPQQADQVALGYAATLGGDQYELSVEGYYKRLSNVTDFVDGADLALNERLETEMLQGRGRAYGLEVHARKRSGRLTGWVSYTLSRSERQLTGLGAGDAGINQGRFYPSPFDKTHDLAVVALHPLGGRWSVGGTFVLRSGLPVTYPVSRGVYDGLWLLQYGDRNAARLPAYHRLDLTFTRSWGGKQLQLGLFNAYNRFNAQSIAFQQVEGNPTQLEAVQTSIFGLVPSASFSFRF